MNGSHRMALMLAEALCASKHATLTRKKELYIESIKKQQAIDTHNKVDENSIETSNHEEDL